MNASTAISPENGGMAALGKLTVAALAALLIITGSSLSAS